MDTQLKSDIAESAVVTELLKRGFNVFRPVGDRLPYDLAIDSGGCLIRIQVKGAWFEESKGLFTLDVRRTKTNRHSILRTRYCEEDFDFAILYVPEIEVFYVIPVEVFISYRSGVG